MSIAFTLPNRVDLLVVGAGPAGMAAAITARAGGASVLLLDEQPGPGGQIYRAIETTPLTARRILGPDYWHGAGLVSELRSSGAELIFGATVWAISDRNAVTFSTAGAAHTVSARQVVLATGAMERPMPLAGWTLPGVMSAGAGQILLKTSGLLPDPPVVLAGTGPLLWLLAAQYLRAGLIPSAILDTTPARNRLAALPHLPGFLTSPYAHKGAALMLEVQRRVPVWRQVREIEARGDSRLTAIDYTDRRGRRRSLPASVLLLHQGIVPATSVPRAAGCAYEWDPALAGPVPVLHGWGETSRPGCRIAGDGGGIAGARAAEDQGRLAALGVLCDLGLLTDAAAASQAAPIRRTLNRATLGRVCLDRLFQPAAADRRGQGDAVLCRCEEISAYAVRDAAALGFDGPNRVKALLRCGMGPCQGRMCGLSVAETLADAHGLPPGHIDTYRQRQPVRPVSLAELGQLPATADDRRAVNGEDIPDPMKKGPQR